MTWQMGHDRPPQRYSRMLLLLCAVILVTGISVLLLARAFRENPLPPGRLTYRTVAVATVRLHAEPADEDAILQAVTRWRRLC